MTKIPIELQNEDRWVVWREETRNGKKTKVPYDAKNGDFAKSNDPATWTT
jgi:putative DNA primase/helicase